MRHRRLKQSRSWTPSTTCENTSPAVARRTWCLCVMLLPCSALSCTTSKRSATWLLDCLQTKHIFLLFLLLLLLYSIQFQQFKDTDLSCCHCWVTFFFFCTVLICNNLKTLTFWGGYIFVLLYSVQFQQFKYTTVFLFVVVVIAVYNFVLLYFCIVSSFNSLKDRHFFWSLLGYVLLLLYSI